MWLFDFLTPAYNIANTIKGLFNWYNIPINETYIIKWDELLLLNDSILSMYNWVIKYPSTWNRNILFDIYASINSLYSQDIPYLKTLNVEQQRKYLIELFNKRELDILQFTASVMIRSAVNNWVNPNTVFWKNTESIIRKVYWFN